MMKQRDRKRLHAYVRRFPNARILVVGDIVLDRYLWGTVSRISPEAPVPVVNVSREDLLLGGATNVAHNIHALGGQVDVCGIVGNDGFGDQLLGLLSSKGISTAGILRDPGRPTTIKSRVIAHNQQVVRFDQESQERLSSKVHRQLFDLIRRRFHEGLDAIVISDYSKGVITRLLVNDIVKLTRRSNTIVSVDPKINHFGMYRGVTILTPNTQEASLGSNIKITDDKTLLMAGNLLLKRLKCHAVLITRGEHGMSLFEEKGAVTHIPTVARNVFDVTGAGDTVISTMTLAMAAGAPLVDAARIANYAAGIVVGVVGTSTVTPEELRETIQTG